MKKFLTANIQKIILIVLVILATISFIQGYKNALYYSQDFQWDAAKALADRVCPYAVSLGKATYNNLYEKVYLQMEANQFPSMLMLLFPYTIVGPIAAKYLWLMSNLIFTAGIVLLLRVTLFKELSDYEHMVLCLLMIAGTPWRNHIGVGQHTIFSFFFFLLALYVLQYIDETEDIKPGHRILLELLCGLFLTVSYFKYTLTAPLVLYFIYRKKYLPVAFSVLIHVVLTIISAIWLGEPVINMIAEPLKVASALTGEGSIDIGALLGGGSFTMVISVIAMLLLLFITLTAKQGRDREIIALLLLWSLVITYHRSYDFWVLIAVYPMVADMYLVGDKMSNLIDLSYGLLLQYIFFGLRLFNESHLSLMIGAVLYYGFVIWMTLIFTGVIKRKETGEREDGK